MHMNYRNEDSDADEDDTEPSQYHPVFCTGLQPDSKVFVFGPEAQFSARCSPIVTCNEFVMEKLAQADALV